MGGTGERQNTELLNIVIFVYCERSSGNGKGGGEYESYWVGKAGITD
jgi:hypothetical protein